MGRPQKTKKKNKKKYKKKRTFICINFKYFIKNILLCVQLWLLLNKRIEYLNFEKKNTKKNLL